MCQHLLYSKKSKGYEDILILAMNMLLKVRFPEYFIIERNNHRGGDIGREKCGQRVFMAAFINKLMSMNKTTLFTKTEPEILQYVNKDFTLSDVEKYADMILKMDVTNIIFVIVHGEAFYH